MTVTAPVDTTHEKRRTRGGIVWFVVLAYALAWAWAVPVALAGGTVDQGRGWPTHVPSLLAPLVAAVVVTGLTEGRTGLRSLAARMGRWRFAPVWWLVVVSPLLVLGATMAVAVIAGQDVPAFGAFAEFGGLPAYGVVQTLLLVFVLNGLGEETGWRGFLQDRLQRRWRPLPATLAVAVVWAVWHMPFFFILSTYAGFDATTLVMFPLGLAAGAIVLTWLYNGTGRSILAVAIWHTLYNMAVATGGATDLLQAVVTTVVMVAAVVLVVAEVVARRRGRGTVLG